MITLNHLVRRKAAVAADLFNGFWLSRHAADLVRLAPALGVRKLTLCETLHDDEINRMMQQLYQTAADAYDFVDQMVINDLDDFKNGIADGAVAAAIVDLHRSEAEYVDHSRSDYWFTIEIPQVFTGGHCVATWENTLLKVLYVPRRLGHLSLEQAQLHWRGCHGAMARQFVEFLPYKKYVQGHRIESRVLQKFKDTLGAEFENIDLMIGQAEAWIDRRIVPTFQGPEVERMMRMLVQDIALFVDSRASHIFAAKEHVVLDRPLISDAIPVLFSAD